MMTHRNTELSSRVLGLLLALSGWLLQQSAFAGDEGSVPRAGDGKSVDFARDVRPIFQRHCVSCHGGVRRKGGLSLLTRADATAAAKSGRQAVVPGDVAGSELVRRVTSHDPDERMPAGGAEPLAAGEIETLRRWIEGGATWEGHWAFEAIKKPDVPAVKDAGWVRNPIDAFVLARLEAEGVRPSPEADRRVLIRRLSLDLLGLPPVPEEVEAFVSDTGDDAYERLVDRLLASPHFGERWGRHWLDLARYADTDGYEVDGPRPNAWYWRDWVIRAVNADMPFDQFTVEQLAGDLLPDATDPQRLATAFHRQTLTNKEGGIDKEEYRTYAVMDRVATTATVWLGLTAACAQCHDHPYDPFTQAEYYQLLAFFNDADEGELRLPAKAESEAAYQRRRAEQERELKELQADLEGASPRERGMLEGRIKELEKKVLSDPGVRLDVIEQRREPRETFVFDRGDFMRPKKQQRVRPGAPAVLHDLRPRSGEYADRLDLARWLVDPANPLTPRVAVNHVWQHLFGVGLVSTPDDFGVGGDPPSHPDLLDWLASEFVHPSEETRPVLSERSESKGWSRKRLIRLVVTSATYRQLSAHRPDLLAADPTNRLLHRQNRLRVEAEVVRDLHLSAAGLLSRKVGGPSVFPPIPKDLAKIDFRSDLKWVVSKGEDRYRRGMYTFFKRTVPDPNLTTFDCPDASATNVRRPTSNTPLQALAALNNEVFAEAARATALRLLARPTDDAGRLAHAYRLCLARDPAAGERERLTRLLASARSWYRENADQARELVGTDLPAGMDPAEAAAWVTVAGVVTNLDEFVTRE